MKRNLQTKKEKNNTYNLLYQKYYYLKKKLADPNYNQKRKKREVLSKTKRELELKESKLKIKG